MAGVGKSILAEQAASRALEDKLFDIVVTAHVSVTPDVKKIQQEIADMFGLQLTEEKETRANSLFQRLKKQNRILIIFYDIWEKLDLGEVGIPWGEEHRRCNIMLISRNHHVLTAMNTQIEFLVKPLSEEEAWRLFKKTAGHSVEETDLQSIADEVAKQCAGLPFAIVTVAKALKNMSMYKWKDALQQLKRSVRTSIRGVDEIIYTSLKLSYDHLISNEARTLFLLCGLLGYCDIPMDHLLKYSVSLGLLEGIDTLEAQTNKLLLLVHHLKASSLLLPAEDDSYVRMHNVVRHVAIEIASKDRHWFVVREGDRLLDWSKIEESVECSGISLNCKNVYVLPEGLVCPKLTFFQLYGNSPKFENPDTFFKGMEELKVLDLSKMHFASLPSSFCSLRNLRTLCLEQCELGDMFLLGELKTLEVLSFVDSHIKELPREMAKLSHLRLLDLRNCSALEVIPQNIISQLSQLEHLCMENSFTQWGAEGFHNQGSNACLSELKHLYLLRTLHVQIPDADLLPENLFTENLTRYRIFIGDEWSGSGNCATSRILKVGKVRSLHLMDRICKLLKRTGGLYLNGIGTKNVLSELAGEGFLELEYLYIQNSAEMQYIINSEEWLPGASAFPVLKSLSLDNLIHLKEICHGPLPMRSFCNLLFLTVENCSILLNVVSFKMLHSLQNLEVLTVKNCDLLEEVFNLEGLDTHGGQMLPKLRELNIIDLPKLKHICNNGLGRNVAQEGADGATDMVEFPQLSSVSLKSLPSLTGFYPGSQTLERLQPGDFDHPLFNEKVAFPRLEVLEISHVDVRRIWDNQLPVNSFENLREMRMTFCQKLFNVVPTSMLKRFKSLQFLSAANCDSLEVVFDLEGMSVLEDVTSIQLRKLVLDDLPKLKHIWTRNPHGFFIFQNLDSVQALSCPMLKNVFPGSEGLGQDILHLEKHLLKFCEMNETADKNGLGEAPGSVFSCVDEISECTSGEPIKDSNSRILMKGRIHP